MVDAYIPYNTTLREVGRIVGIDHHRVKRILESEGITIVKGRRGPFTAEHKKNISKACKGRRAWSKGKKMPKSSLYKNMSVHIRFDVSAEWLAEFSDIEKLKFLNRCITDRSGRFDVSTEWYVSYIEKFYDDNQFNNIYFNWIVSQRNKWLRPTLDHINPKASGGCNSLDNLQFLTWFENRAKCDMSQAEWEQVKANIKDYMI